MTLDEIERRVGEIIVTASSGAIEEYVQVLLDESLLEEGERTHHFRLTDSGKTLLEGVLASPAAEERRASASN